MIELIIGLIVGSILGIIVIALCVSSKLSDYEMELYQLEKKLKTIRGEEK